MTASTDGNLPADTQGYRAEGVYVPGTGTVAQQGGTLGSDTGGQPYASTVMQLQAAPVGGYSYTNITTATTTLVKTGAGTLHSVTINTGVASATIELDDALTHTTPKIGTLTCQASTVGNPVTVVYDIAFSTGLSITTSGATDITVAWK